MKQKKRITTQTIAAIGIMTALVFASNYVQFMIPTPIGPTRIHIANGICLLAALLFGGLKGGVAAGLGSFFYDLTFPDYVATSWVTLLLKFLMALICGLIVYAGTKREDGAPAPVWRRLVGTIAGALSYVAMYMVKQFVEGCLVYQYSVEAVAFTSFTVKLPVSLLNAAIAVPIAFLLHNALRPAFQRAQLREKFGIH